MNRDDTENLETETRSHGDEADGIDTELESAATAAENPADGGNLRQRLEEAEKRVLLYQADLENFRRRKNRETAEQIRYASVPLVQNLLDVVDNLDRALGSTSSGDQPDPESLRQGVHMVLEQLQHVLETNGCRPIEALGKPFDPNMHEAIQSQPSDQPANSVITEVQTGYQLHDRVIRPAKVIISSGEPPQG